MYNTATDSSCEMFVSSVSYAILTWLQKSHINLTHLSHFGKLTPLPFHHFTFHTVSTDSSCGFVCLFVCFVFTSDFPLLLGHCDLCTCSMEIYVLMCAYYLQGLKTISCAVMY